MKLAQGCGLGTNPLVPKYILKYNHITCITKILSGACYENIEHEMC
jgi:hypothetical protein